MTRSPVTAVARTGPSGTQPIGPTGSGEYAADAPGENPRPMTKSAVNHAAPTSARRIATIIVPPTQFP